MTLVFATNNAHKLEEVQAALGGALSLRTLADIGCTEDLPENETTLEGNARSKAWYLYRTYGPLNCFADDTGLEIEALNGEPGVYSARYAGPQRSAADNMALVLQNLQGQTNRRAQFRSVFCLILNGQEYLFEGIVPGQILTAPQGEAGFGYDPIFQPEGETRSFAQMSLDEKNARSHRARALEKMKAFLQGSKPQIGSPTSTRWE